MLARSVKLVRGPLCLRVVRVRGVMQVCHCFLARAYVGQRNGCRIRIVSARSAPVEIIAMGTPVSASMRRR